VRRARESEGEEVARRKRTSEGGRRTGRERAPVPQREEMRRILLGSRGRRGGRERDEKFDLQIPTTTRSLPPAQSAPRYFPTIPPRESVSETRARARCIEDPKPKIVAWRGESAQARKRASQRAANERLSSPRREPTSFIVRCIASPRRRMRSSRVCGCVRVGAPPWRLLLMKNEPSVRARWYRRRYRIGLFQLASSSRLRLSPRARAEMGERCRSSKGNAGHSKRDSFQSRSLAGERSRGSTRRSNSP